MNRMCFHHNRVRVCISDDAFGAIQKHNPDVYKSFVWGSFFVSVGMRRMLEFHGYGRSLIIYMQIWQASDLICVV